MEAIRVKKTNTDRRNKQFPADVTVNDGERSVLARISTISVDRDGEVMIPQGCDATDFLKSPTVFYNHNYDLPIGRCAAIKRDDKVILAKTVFAVRPEKHEGEWLPDTIFALMQQNIINGFSVGFSPIESRPAGNAEVEKYGPQCRMVTSKSKMMEYSVAPLPANQDALALAVSKGIMTAATCAKLFPGVEVKVVKPRPKQIIIPVVLPKPKAVEVAVRLPQQPSRSAEQIIRDEVQKSLGLLYAQE